MTDTKTDAPALAAGTFTVQPLPEVLEMLKVRMSAQLAKQQAAKESEQQAMIAHAQQAMSAQLAEQQAQMIEFLEMARQGVQGLTEPYRSEAVQVLAKLEMDIGDGALAAFDALIASHTPSPDH